MTTYVVGQRFVSEAEPELGLGLVEGVEGRHIVLRFPASATVRRYASASAPIKRVVYRVGDEVFDHVGNRFRIEAVEERGGLLFYRGPEFGFAETALSDRLSFSTPVDRFLAGICDRSRIFDLRLRSHELRHRYLKSPARGFLGGRIELIPHQLYISHEVASRPFPRALLADEVGLGKTIEVGLVLHRLLRSGQMNRVLILVPESLVHQWFVEMYRRFHLSFTLVDESYYQEAVTSVGENPFLGIETAISSLELLAAVPERSEHAASAGWDMLVVDEAHHLRWSEEAPGADYRLVARIASQARGVLLLTATPEQLGEESHFARLKLLDPDRYSSLERYRRDAEKFHDVAKLAGRLLDGQSLSPSETRRLGGVTSLAELVDRHGPGRVVFRNTRKVLDRFPARRVHPVRLQSWSDLERDPRVSWLAAFLRDIAPEKVLMICRSRETAVAVSEELRQTRSITAGVFHEGLSLRERDRQAAWFAEADGAQVLLCSEIGSEGRNFQFAHHLVLFDLPSSPELLEQRIGRLYRIGQTETVEIHVPIVEGSAEELIFRWFHEGLEAFEKSPPSGSFFDPLVERLHDFAPGPGPGSGRANGAAFEAFLEDARRFRERLLRELEAGRDRLLELGSFRPARAAALMKEIGMWDEDRELDFWIEDALDYLGVELEEIGRRTFRLRQGSGLVVDALPGLRADEVGMTCDRDRATHQGELDFLTWDHPMTTGVLELLLGGEHGNCARALLADGRESGLMLEAVFVLEVVAPPELYVDRFLPPTPMRIVVDDLGREATDLYSGEDLTGRLRDAPGSFGERELPGLVERATRIAEKRAPALVASGLSEMRESMGQELRRLRALQEINDHVRPEEIARVEQEAALLEKVIAAARVRLDALRYIRIAPHAARS
ncbi:MAG TPA: SNF2-related protein [Vicinamibacteria bacterium]|nr:SNF2-related protein [Vicinamibacteria bacterium]